MLGILSIFHENLVTFLYMLRLKGPRFPLMPLNGARSCLSIVSSSSGVLRLYPSQVASVTSTTTTANIIHIDSLADNILRPSVVSQCPPGDSRDPGPPSLLYTLPGRGQEPPAPAQPMTVNIAVITLR